MASRPLIRAVGCGVDKLKLSSKITIRDNDNPLPSAQATIASRPLIRAVGCGVDKLKLSSKITIRDNDNPLPSAQAPGIRDDGMTSSTHTRRLNFNGELPSNGESPLYHPTRRLNLKTEVALDGGSQLHPPTRHLNLNSESPSDGESQLHLPSQRLSLGGPAKDKVLEDPDLRDRLMKHNSSLSTGFGRPKVRFTNNYDTFSGFRGRERYVTTVGGNKQ
ncbi:hypothetical protein K3495_g10246 [Podosphaera aphanis]|nr:hypothetical protein K3495_g10246 [Podosphaera aphanis]